VGLDGPSTLAEELPPVVVRGDVDDGVAIGDANAVPLVVGEASADLHLIALAEPLGGPRGASFPDGDLAAGLEGVERRRRNELAGSGRRDSWISPVGGRVSKH
jgi:hypothetical protein